MAARTVPEAVSSASDAFAGLRVSSVTPAPASEHALESHPSWRELSIDQVDAADCGDAKRVGDYAHSIIRYNQEREVRAL